MVGPCRDIAWSGARSGANRPVPLCGDGSPRSFALRFTDWRIVLAFPFPLIFRGKGTPSVVLTAGLVSDAGRWVCSLSSVAADLVCGVVVRGFLVDGACGSAASSRDEMWRNQKTAGWAATNIPTQGDDAEAVQDNALGFQPRKKSLCSPFIAPIPRHS